MLWFETIPLDALAQNVLKGTKARLTKLYVSSGSPPSANQTSVTNTPSPPESPQNTTTSTTATATTTNPTSLHQQQQETDLHPTRTDSTHSSKHRHRRLPHLHDLMSRFSLHHRHSSSTAPAPPAARNSKPPKRIVGPEVQAARNEAIVTFQTVQTNWSDELEAGNGRVQARVAIEEGRVKDWKDMDSDSDVSKAAFFYFCSVGHLIRLECILRGILWRNFRITFRCYCALTVIIVEFFSIWACS